jgi:hypothetical protein
VERPLALLWLDALLQEVREWIGHSVLVFPSMWATVQDSMMWTRGFSHQ